MAPAFSKEAILQGSIDHLCLACESYLRSERDVWQHVSTAGHRKNLDATDYVDKYRNDRVRKVKKWYYCEFCNVLVSTITKVRLHVEEQGHKENKSSQMITRVDDVILSGNIAISDEAWHGFINENTCIICDVEFDDRDDHKNESSHIINLIQNKVRNDFNNSYRKIDGSTFHCLTCNTVVADITAHFDDAKHKTLIQKCIKTKLDRSAHDTQTIFRATAKDFEIENPEGKSNGEDVINISGNRISKDIEDINTSGDKISTKGNGGVKIDEDVIMDQKYNDPKVNNNKHTPDILDSIPVFQKEHIDVNLESHTVVCRRCSITLEFDCKVIHNHIEEHKHDIQKKANGVLQKLLKEDDKNKRKDGGKTSPVTQDKNTEKIAIIPIETTKPNLHMIQKVVEEYNLTYSDNKVYCQTCNKHIPTCLKNINEHVNGESHKKTIISSKATDLKENENKKLNVKKQRLQKVPIQEFVRKIITIRSMFAEDVIINEKYCINVISFTYLTMTSPGKLRCLVCEENVLLQNMKNHLDIRRHERALNETPVIIHTDSEFIREIRSNKFHCGFCNFVDSWEGMEDHLKSTSHKESKNFANWRLTQHMPAIQQHNMERQIHNEFMMRLMLS